MKTNATFTAPDNITHYLCIESLPARIHPISKKHFLFSIGMNNSDLPSFTSPHPDRFTLSVNVENPRVDLPIVLINGPSFQIGSKGMK